jgi:tetratricopeptide (TPR) repeat protein
MRFLILSLVGLLFYSESRGQDVPNLIAMGNQAMNNGAYREAQNYYQAALVKEPQNWNLYILIGFSVHKQKKFKDADSIYNIAAKNDSNSSKVFWYKGMNHIAMGQDSAAIVNYKRFIELEKGKNGSLIQAHRSIGQCYERMLKKDGLYSWQIDDMIYHYEEIEKADPSYVEVPVIRNFIEIVQSKRPANQVGKWKMEP